MFTICSKTFLEIINFKSDLTEYDDNISLKTRNNKKIVPERKKVNENEFKLEKVIKRCNLINSRNAVDRLVSNALYTTPFSQCIVRREVNLEIV